MCEVVAEWGASVLDRFHKSDESDPLDPVVRFDVSESKDTNWAGATTSTITGVKPEKCLAFTFVKE
jgi:hypothetical protein